MSKSRHNFFDFEIKERSILHELSSRIQSLLSRCIEVFDLIDNRPEVLMAREGYVLPFPGSLSANLSTIPEMMRVALGSLGGVQPVTIQMAEITNGELRDQPSPEEIEYFKANQTRFQLIQVVLNLVYWETKDDVVCGLPYSISLMPSSKRGNVTHATIDFVAQAGVPGMNRQNVFRSFNPFSGEWSFWSRVENFVGRGNVFFDQIGVVCDYFFLATDYRESDVLSIGNPDWPWHERFNRKRTKQLFKPFTDARPRRIWGVESPIELFLLQELISRSLVPEAQIMIMRDGSLFPSFYDALETMPDGVEPPITEADFYFSKQKVAVFCDGAHHQRTKQRRRDEKIDNRLNALGITPVRISGSEIVRDLVAAGDTILGELQAHP